MADIVGFNYYQYWVLFNDEWHVDDSSRLRPFTMCELQYAENCSELLFIKSDYPPMEGQLCEKCNAEFVRRILRYGMPKLRDELT